MNNRPTFSPRCTASNFIKLFPFASRPLVRRVFHVASHNKITPVSLVEDVAQRAVWVIGLPGYYVRISDYKRLRDAIAQNYAGAIAFAEMILQMERQG